MLDSCITSSNGLLLHSCEYLSTTCKLPALKGSRIRYPAVFIVTPILGCIEDSYLSVTFIQLLCGCKTANMRLAYRYSICYPLYAL